MGVPAGDPAPTPPAPGATRPKSRARRVGLLLLVAVALALVSPLVGPVSIPFATVVGIILHQASGGLLAPQPCPTTLTGGKCGAYIAIVWDERIPEVVLAVIAGAALAMSGATLQGVFRNPLADPYLLGLSAGGSLGAAVLLVLKVGFAEANFALPLFAFLGAFATGLIILLAALSPRSSIESLLLVGVALGYLLSATLTVVLLFNPQGSIQVSYWLLGGLGGATWTRDGIALGGVIVAAAVILLFGRQLNLLQLGQDVAQSLGVRTGKVRWNLLLLTSLATAMAVAFTGVIGFVGLISPHVVRRLFSSDYRIVLPGSAIVGAMFLLAAHDLSLVVAPGSELPVGIFTAFAGAPFFLYMLYRRRLHVDGV